jgi:Predicted divalent heavy-metal cations transporter
VGDLELFLRDAVLITAVFAGVYLLLWWVERRATARGMPQSLLKAFIVALAYGVHNVGGGFAIAGILLSGGVDSALFFTVGFAVHNATEGFGIAAPLHGDRRTRAAKASLVYDLLYVNLSAMSKLGGVSSPRFWLALTAGVAAAFATESALSLGFST